MPITTTDDKSATCRAKKMPIKQRVLQLESDLQRVREAAQDLADANEILSHASDRFRNLFQEMPIPTFSYDVEGNLFEWNRAFELHQLLKDAPITRPVWDVLSQPGIWPNSKDIVRRVISGEFIDGEECDCRLNNAALAQVIYSSFPLKSPDGVVIGGIGTYFDITEIKRSEIERTSHSKQQLAIMDLGQMALTGVAVSKLIEDACKSVRDAIQVDFTIVFELFDGGPELFVLACDGCPEDIYGLKLTEKAWEDSRDKQEAIDLSPDIPISSNILNARASDSDQSAPDAIGAVAGHFDGETRFPASELLKSVGVASGISVPICEGSTAFGILGAYELSRREFSAQDVRFMQSVANVIASSLQRERSSKQLSDYMAVLQEQKKQLESANLRLETLATIDGLTGLKNHRYFQERLAQDFHTAHTDKSPLSLILLDVDHFKSYNDTFGHPEGDEVLRRVATILQRQCRNHDTVARYGGEEFVVILPGADASVAANVAERLRTSIAFAEWWKRPVTASFGVATVMPRMREQGKLLREADRALYTSKHAGRNRVTSARVNNIPAE